VRLIAHRGASGRFPENTLASFRAALRMGARAMECDVQLSKDGRLVVIHDFTLERLCGRAVPVRSLSFAELSRLDAGAWKAPRFGGERIPALERLLRLVPAGVELHVEVKQPPRPYPGIEERLVKALRARPRRLEDIVVSSFSAPTIARLRRLDGGLRLAFLVGRAPLAAAVSLARRARCEAWHLSRRRCGPAWLRAAAREGLKVRVYTVNDRDEAVRLGKAGVEAVFTDYPDLERGR
jgi:glycerophosphoryl diester phosphodiesterase